ncbi:MAG: hypothetical protein CM15mP93_12420 [Thiotrichaceae bacterium]|nr:MAG: hypothetical protein CM15mP93_12420 [Thiotrichaceae bacterium]
MKTTKLNNSFIVLFLSLVLFSQSYLNNNIIVDKNKFEICTLHNVKFVTNWTFDTEEFNCCSDFLVILLSLIQLRIIIPLFSLKKYSIFSK